MVPYPTELRKGSATKARNLPPSFRKPEQVGAERRFVEAIRNPVWKSPRDFPDMYHPWRGFRLDSGSRPEWRGDMLSPLAGFVSVCCWQKPTVADLIITRIGRDSNTLSNHFYWQKSRD